jgi:hemerythrin superfamily protein
MKDGSPTKAILNDGTVTNTWSREWQCENLARHTYMNKILRLLGKENRAARDAIYAEVRELSGELAEKRLREAVAEKWEAEKKRQESMK